MYSSDSLIRIARGSKNQFGRKCEDEQLAQKKKKGKDISRISARTTGNGRRRRMNIKC